MKLAHNYKSTPPSVTIDAKGNLSNGKRTPTQEEEKVAQIEEKVALTDHSRRIGKGKHYFSELRQNDPVTFRFIRLLGKGDMSNGYNLLEKYKKKVVGRLKYIRKALIKKGSTKAFYSAHRYSAHYLVKGQSGAITMHAVRAIKRIEADFDRWDMQKRGVI